MYEFCGKSPNQPVRVLDSIPQAHRDWITCLAMAEYDSGHYIIVSGGNDHGVGVWLFVNSAGSEYPSLSQIWFAQEHSHPLIALSFKVFICSFFQAFLIKLVFNSDNSCAIYYNCVWVLGISFTVCVS